MFWFFLRFLLVEWVADLLWWWWADRRVRVLRGARWYRLGIAVFVVYQTVSFWIIIASRLKGFEIPFPAVPLAAVYLWHLLILPMWVIWMAMAGLGRGVRRLVRRIRAEVEQAALAADSAPAVVLEPVGPTRRQVLAACAVAVPPLLNAGAVVGALGTISSFRIRSITAPLAMLPAELDGLTIAHVSDVHVGRFTNGRLLDSVVEETNRLSPDLILFSGDLIDYSLEDLPEALRMLKRLEARHGLYVCEGNHDLFDDRAEFEGRVRDAGVKLLVNDGAELTVRGKAVQILGLQWGWPGLRYGLFLGENMNQLLRVRDPRAFPILVAHHPESFEYADAANIPLTLAGHTHGGQLMLTKNIGVGPWMFRYFSGLYRKPSGTALVVSNGVGNWFPLRINAPAEIIHLTLRCVP